MRHAVLSITTLLILLSGFWITADGQNFRQMRQELEERQQETRSEIESLQQQLENVQQKLSETEDAYDELYQQFQNTQQEISLRDALIENKLEERDQLEDEMEMLRSSIDQLRDDLDHLIEQYKETLTYVYKHGRTSNLALIFSANSLNQMLIRARYLNEFEEHRQRQAEQIEEKQAELRREEQQLEKAHERVAANIRETESEQEELEQAKVRQQEQIAELQQDRQRLEENKNAREREAQELENTLASLIEEEMEIQEAEEERRRELEEKREQRMADAENIRGSTSASSGASASLPDEAELEDIGNRFEQRKGSLPWPVNEGTISEQFGDRENPLYGTRIYNPGIQISTSPRNDVKAVHDGYVFAVRPMPGYGNTVFVNHGRFNTVYGNLSEVNVNRNTFLQEGDTIGKSGDENTLNGQVVFFMISEGSADHFDPEEWMSKP